MGMRRFHNAISSPKKAQKKGSEPLPLASHDKRKTLLQAASTIRQPHRTPEFQ